jgi:hypothetical protein
MAVKKWCREQGGAGSICGFITVTMEYGKDPRPLGKRDPFAENRVGKTGPTSHFLHPIFRVFAPMTGGEWKRIAEEQLAEHSLTDWSGERYTTQMWSLMARCVKSQRLTMQKKHEKKKKSRRT